jgi:hypothetical protein
MCVMASVGSAAFPHRPLSFDLFRFMRVIMTELAKAEYLVEIEHLEAPRNWTPVAFRLTLVGAQFELQLRRRDSPSRAFRILHRQTEQIYQR